MRAVTGGVRVPGPPVGELAAALIAASPELDPTGQRLAVTVYRSLAEGEPVDEDLLVERSGIAAAQVARALDAWPGVFRDEAGRIIGFWGLCIPRTAHRFRVGGRELHTWCAWDTLFLASPDAGARWLADRPDGFLLSLDEGFELGRRFIHARVGAAL